MHRLRLLAAAAACCCALQAQAFTATLSAGASAPMAGVLTDGFDAPSAFFDVQGGAVYSAGSAGAQLTGSGISLIPGVSAQPFKDHFERGDAWFSVGQGQQATITFASAVGYVGFLWGSADAYNSVSFYDHDTLIASFSGGSLLAGGVQLPSGGDQGKSSYFNFSAGEITSVVFASASPAFEIDNLSALALSAPAAGVMPVPEPDSAWLMLSGLGLAAAAALRRRRAARA